MFCFFKFQQKVHKGSGRFHSIFDKLSLAPRESVMLQNPIKSWNEQIICVLLELAYVLNIKVPLEKLLCQTIFKDFS